MKKILGCMVITWFFTLPAMEKQELKIFIKNETPAPIVLGITMRDRPQYHRALFPIQYDYFYAIDYKPVEALSVCIDGGEFNMGFLDIDPSNPRHQLIVFNPAISHYAIDEPLKTKYPEFNPASERPRYIDYFPGAYWYMMNTFSPDSPYRPYVQEASDEIPAQYFLNLPEKFSKLDLQVAYDEACAKWKPEQFENPDLKEFAERMIQLIESKYKTLASLQE